MDYKSLNPDLRKRKEEFKKIKFSHPNMIPAIVQPMNVDKKQTMNNFKFLVPKAYSFQEFQFNIRKRIKLAKSATLFLVVGEKQVPALDKSMLNVDKEFKDPDGFLYIYYSIESNFGC